MEMKQQKTFVCQKSNHEDEEIQGFCLNVNCKDSKSQFCFQCLIDPQMHQTCKKDLIRFNQMQILIQQFKEESQNLILEINKVYEKIKQKYEKLIKQQEQKISFFNRIIGQMNNMNYQEVTESLTQIKQYYDYLNRKGKVTEENQHGADLLNANQFIKSLGSYDLIQKEEGNKDNINSNFNQTIQLLTKQKWEEATDLLEKKIQELQKELSFALFFQSLTLVEINQVGKALIQRDKAKTINSSVIEDLLKYSEYELQKSPDDIALLIIKCYALQEVNMFQESLEICNKVLNDDPDHLLMLNRKWFSLNQLGKHQQAIDCIDKAIKINPNYAIGFNQKAYSLGSQEKYLESIDNYKEAIRCDPNLNFAYNNIGYNLILLEKYAEALIWLNKAIDLYPNYKFAYYNKGISLNHLNRNDEALLLYEKVITIDPNWFEGYKKKGEILMKQKKHDQAVETYQQALRFCRSEVEGIISLIEETNIKNLE